MATLATRSGYGVVLRTLEAQLGDLLAEYGSTGVIDRGHCSVAVVDDRSKVAFATDGAHVANIEAIIDHCDKLFGRLKPGDAMITNDPYAGGTRVKDHFLLAPVVGAHGAYHGLAVVTAPFFDVGGKHLGGEVPEALDLFAEGVRTTPVRVRRGGVVVADIKNLLLLNSRTARLVDADVTAMLHAADRIAEGALDVLSSDLSAGAIADARAAVDAAVPVGSCMQIRREVLADGLPAPVSVDMTIKRDGSPIVVDFDGSHGQVGSPHNSTLATTSTAVARAFRDHLGCGWNSGVTELLEIRSAAGSIVDCSVPSPVGGARRSTCAVIYEMVRSCLEEMSGQRTTEDHE